MISAFGVEHGDGISKAAKCAKCGFSTHPGKCKVIKMSFQDRKALKPTAPASTGRKILAASPVSTYNGIAAGKKGVKLRAGANQGVRAAGGGLAGGMAGSLGGALLTRGRSPKAAIAGGAVGALSGFGAGGTRGRIVNERKGYLKPQGS